MATVLGSSIHSISGKVPSYHPVTGELYEFQVTTSFYQYKHDRQSSGQIDLQCWRGAEFVSIMRYDIEPMNNFSLFALASQYQELCFDWIYSSPTDHKITTAMKCFKDKHGPIIKLGNKEVKSLGLQIVEVTE
jgi:hypothetical protein